MRRIFTIILALDLAGCAGEFNPDLGGGTLDDSTGGEGTDTGDATDGSTDDTGGSDDTGGTDTGIPDGCGDGEAQGDEECDGLDLRGAECTAFESPGVGNYSGGQLACNDDCTLDHGSCTYCGDGVKNHASEECDGEDMGGLTCEDEGFDGGELGCDEQCSSVQTACENCEGDPAGIYGDTKSDCGDGGTFSHEGHGVCLPPCSIDADCVDPELSICDVQAVCEGFCKLVCETDDDCPGGMSCHDTGSYGLMCMWLG